MQNDVFVVSDASADSRFLNNPLVNEGPNIRFYAGAPLFAPDGQPIGTVCVIDSKPREVSFEQTNALTMLSNQVTKLLELRLQLSKLRTLNQQLVIKSTAINNIVEGVVVQDSQSAIIDFNPAALHVLGLTVEQLTGKTSYDPSWSAVHEDGSPIAGDKHPSVNALRTGKKQSNVVMGIYSDSKNIRWLSVNSIPLFAESGTAASHTVTSFSDITVQIENQRIIENGRRQSRFILDSIPHMIALWSSDLINVDANEAYAAYLGKSVDRIHGRHMKQVIGEKISEENLARFHEVVSGKTVTFETVLPQNDGPTRHTLATFVPNFVEGTVESVLAIVVDITELKKHELEKRNLELQLAESARLSALGEMAGGVAHEINNPLAIIRGKSSLLIERIKSSNIQPADVITQLERIELTVDRIAKILKGLRTYSRSADNDPFEKIDVKSVVEDTVVLCREKFRLAQVELSVVGNLPLLAECRATEISQITMNLLSNSFDAVSDLSSKWVVITLNEDSDSITVTITDSGLGIDVAVSRKMMNPFFTTKDVGKGTGLGLSISRSIAESHGGSLQYDGSRSNTTLILKIPKLQSGSGAKAG